MSIYVFLNIKTWTVKQLNVHKFYITSRVRTQYWFTM